MIAETAELDVPVQPNQLQENQALWMPHQCRRELSLSPQQTSCKLKYGESDSSHHANVLEGHQAVVC
jgi:hypothetical protein